MSHPTWVRGLKQQQQGEAANQQQVAPYVGAWIETFLSISNTFNKESHPTWVRGLKQLKSKHNKKI